MVPKSPDSDKALTPRQSEIVDYIMTTGKAIRQVAEHIGTDPSNIYRTLRLPHVIKEMHSRTLEHIGLLAPYAARTQQQLLEADSEHVRATVAENILDRQYGKPIMRQQLSLQGIIKVHIDLS